MKNQQAAESRFLNSQQEIADFNKLLDDKQTRLNYIEKTNIDSTKLKKEINQIQEFLGESEKLGNESKEFLSHIIVNIQETTEELLNLDERIKNLQEKMSADISRLTIEFNKVQVAFKEIDKINEQADINKQTKTLDALIEKENANRIKMEKSLAANEISKVKITRNLKEKILAESTLHPVDTKIALGLTAQIAQDLPKSETPKTNMSPNDIQAALKRNTINQLQDKNNPINARGKTIHKYAHTSTALDSSGGLLSNKPVNPLEDSYI